VVEAACLVPFLHREQVWNPGLRILPGFFSSRGQLSGPDLVVA